ncbi:CC0125/CC1285 family lipoprotein [Herbaspirillum rhizosphaerae]|uniref:CC0125/CC1285 family lipoprotein n=1 Tax=Herbaspirillum rhizosphaerae TaxID=346179 RepID=UPI00067B9207|nr:hypothetical protein [Herbaspirillum rhizosphaerae]
MMTNQLRLTLLCLLSAVAMLAGCKTAYGPRSFTGGYTESKIDDSTYRVSFSGNGHTTRNMVWYYWIYRCAELTTQNGYAFFVMNPAQVKNPSSSQNDSDTTRLADLQVGNGVPVSPMATRSAPTFIYVPGNTVTSYSGSGIIKMLHSPSGYNGLLVLRASTIMEMVAPYVKSEGRTAVPSDIEILKAAFAGTMAPPAAAGRQPSRPMTMDDLKNLLPPP